MKTTRRIPPSRDWAFLILLWLTGVSGFALEIADYLPKPAPWTYWTLLVPHFRGG